MPDIICCLLFCLKYVFNSLPFSYFCFKQLFMVLQMARWNNLNKRQWIRYPKASKNNFWYVSNEKREKKNLENIVACNVLPDNLSPSLGEPIGTQSFFPLLSHWCLLRAFGTLENWGHITLSAGYSILAFLIFFKSNANGGKGGYKKTSQETK